MFKKNFKIEAIRTDGVRVTIYMRGTRKELKHDIEMYKEMSDKYSMFGNKGMVIWTSRAI